MKEIAIKNEFDKSYLLIEKKEEDNYIFKMLLQNRVFGLLECRMRYLDTCSYCAYDITSKKSLEQEYADKKIQFSDLLQLFCGIHQIMNRANEYLLNESHFILEPEFIFLDMETKDIYCLYFPEDEDVISRKERYHKLADFLLDKIEHKDEHAVNVAYHFYKISKEDYFSFEAFVCFIEKEALLVQAKQKRENSMGQNHNSQLTAVHTSGEQNYFQEKELSSVRHEDIEQNRKGQEEFEEDAEYTVTWWKVSLFFIVGGIGTGGYFLLPTLKNYALYILIPGLTSVVFAIILLIRNLYYIYKRKIEKEEVIPEEPVRIEEYFDSELDDVTVFFDKEEYMHLKWKEGHFSKEYLLEDFPVTIGKLKESVQMVINDASISRLHARIRKQGDTLYLQDLDSTNGTFINDKRLQTGEEAIIRRGDEIQFGKIIVNVV